jgi:hypothetical protein
LAYLERGHLARSGAFAFALAGELLQAVFLRFLINKLAKARLLSLFDCFASCGAQPYCFLFVVKVL